jgi:hypothetical protein
MTVTVLDPAAGTSNPHMFARPVIAVVTANMTDPKGLYDMIVVDAAGGVDVTIVLPVARLFPGKPYTVYFRSLTGLGSWHVGIAPTAPDTIALGAVYLLGAVGLAVSLVSDGISDWVPSTINLNVTLPNSVIPVATDLLNGGVLVVGTPAHVAAPSVPVIETGGVLGTTASPVIVPLAPLTLAGAAGDITFINGLAVARTDPT